MGMAGIPQIPLEIRGNEDRCCGGNTAGWKWELRGSRGDGICFFSGTPHGLFRNLADDKNSGASVRILGIDCHVKLVM